MRKEDFLLNALKDRVLFLRYCVEDIRYLGIEFNGKPIEQIALLQKCFCDIPLHQITKKFDLLCLDEGVNINELDIDNTHTGFYGPYGIAFSKEKIPERNISISS